MNSFEVRELPGKGRGLVAVKPINVGDTIFEEEPLVSCQFSWNASYGYAACDHCMRPLETIAENIRRLTNHNDFVIPLAEYDPTLLWIKQFTQCPNCQVRYCSEDCRMQALNSYHRVGCLGAFHLDDTHPINKLNNVWKQMHFPPETGSIMLLVRLMAMYKQSNNKPEFLKTIQSFQSSVFNQQEQIYHKMLGGNFASQMEQLYEAFCLAFQDNEFSIFTTPEAFKSLMGLVGTNSQGIATSVLAEWVTKVCDVKLSDVEREKLDQFIDNMYLKVNKFAGEFLNNEGSGLYFLQSKINHSCVPNAESTFPYSNDIVVLKAIKAIQPGEEICISYIDECQLDRSRHSRQKILRDNYIFLCQCPKCISQADEPDLTSDDDDDEDYDEEIDDDCDLENNAESMEMDN